MKLSQRYVILSIVMLIMLAGVGNAATLVNMSFNYQQGVYSSTLAEDISGNNQDGTVHGATFNQSSIYGKSYYFDGNDYIDLPSNYNTANTVSALVKFSGTAQNKYIVTNGDSTVDWTLYMSDGKIKCANSSSVHLDTDATFGDGEWHHVLCIIEPLNLYVDGVDVATTLVSSTTGVAGSAKIGAKSSTQFFFTGYIDEVLILSDTYNQSDVTNLYNQYINTKHYFISNDGDNSNMGFSSAEPIKTIEAINQYDIYPGDEISFERGSVFSVQEDAFISFTSGNSSDRITYSDYGTGELPRIYGSYDGSISTRWSEPESNIWAFSEVMSASSVGIIIFNNESSIGSRVTNYGNLNVQGEFWYNTTNNNTYLYSTSIPSTFYSEIEIAPYKNIVDWSSNDYFNFRNLDVRYGGRHGMTGYNTNSINITGCNVRYIGGGGTTRLGNCIEFGLASDDIYVGYTNVSECYDAGISSQAYNGGGIKTISNQIFEYNIIINSSYGYEFFAEDAGSRMDNITLNHTTIIGSGYGWANKAEGVGIRLADVDNVNSFIIENNIIYNSSQREIYLDNGWDGTLPVLDYDLYYSQLSDDYSWNSTFYETLSDFQTGTGNEANGLEQDPLLDENYQPSWDSPVCGTASDGGDIGALECANPTINDTVLYYPFLFNESNTTFTPDHSENGYDGTVSGATLEPGYDRYNFNIGDYIQSDSPALQFNKSISMFAWAYAKEVNTGAGSRRVVIGTDSNEILLRIYDGVGGSPKLATYLDGAACSIDDMGSLKLNTWFQVGITYDGVRVRGWINGTETGSLSCSAGDINIAEDSIYVGKQPGQLRDWNGSIDEVRIYDYNLSDSEVQQLYEQGYSNESNCIDADGDGFNASVIDPACGSAIQLDCDDTNASIIPFEASTTFTASAKFCSGINADISTTAITINANDIVIDCNSITIAGDFTEGTYPINFNAKTGVILKNCKFENYTADVWMYDGDKIINSTFKHKGNISSRIRTSYILDTNITFLNNQDNEYGIINGMGNLADLTIDNCNLTSNSTDYGFHLVSFYDGANLTITNSYINMMGNSSGNELITIGNVDEIIEQGEFVFENNTLTDSRGLTLNGKGTTGNSNWIVKNNTMINIVYGIDTKAALKVKGLHAYNNTINCTFTGRFVGTVLNNWCFGMNLDTLNNSLIRDNIIYHSEDKYALTAGLGVADNVTISNNEIYIYGNCDGIALGLSRGIIIENNYIEGVINQTGISLGDTNNTIVRNNIINVTSIPVDLDQSYGIQAYLEHKNNTIENNTFIGAKYCIKVSEDTSNNPGNTYKNNTMTDCIVDVWYNKGDNTTFLNNIYTNGQATYYVVTSNSPIGFTTNHTTSSSSKINLSNGATFKWIGNSRKALTIENNTVTGEGIGSPNAIYNSSQATAVYTDEANITQVLLPGTRVFVIEYDTGEPYPTSIATTITDINYSVIGTNYYYDCIGTGTHIHINLDYVEDNKGYTDIYRNDVFSQRIKENTVTYNVCSSYLFVPSRGDTPLSSSSPVSYNILRNVIGLLVALGFFSILLLPFSSEKYLNWGMKEWMYWMIIVLIATVLLVALLNNIFSV